MLFFCFKQKTAYEMLISDWSSDVCSSDLAITHLRRSLHAGGKHADQVVGRQDDHEGHEADSHALRVDAHGPDRAKPGKAKTHGGQWQCMTHFNTIALVVAPQGEHHVWHKIGRAHV